MKPSPGRNFLLISGILLIFFGCLIALNSIRLFGDLFGITFVFYALFSIFAGIVGIVYRKKAEKTIFVLIISSIFFGISSVFLVFILDIIFLAIQTGIGTRGFGIAISVGIYLAIIAIIVFPAPILHIIGAIKNAKAKPICTTDIIKKLVEYLNVMHLRLPSNLLKVIYLNCRGKDGSINLALVSKEDWCETERARLKGLLYNFQQDANIKLFSASLDKLEQGEVLWEREKEDNKNASS